MTRPDPTPIFSLRSRSFVAGSFETGPEDDSIGPIRDIFCQRSSRPRSIAIDEREKKNETRGNEMRDRGAMMIDSVPKMIQANRSAARPLFPFVSYIMFRPRRSCRGRGEKKKEKRDGKGTRPDIEPVASILFEEISISRNGTKRKNKIPFAIN